MRARVPPSGSQLYLAKQAGDKKSSLVIPENIRGKRILAVDDNVTNRLILREHLLSWGCQHDEAANGTEALSKLRKAVAAHNPFDLAILDMDMPDIDGATLGRKIKEDPNLCQTILVMLTSRGRRGDAKQMQEIGFSAYLTKPIKSSQLYDCLAMVVGSKPAAPDATPVPIITRHSLMEETGCKIRILLAEDNIINQKVALGILGKIGYRADVAVNGKEVLAALEKTPYDLDFNGRADARDGWLRGHRGDSPKGKRDGPAYSDHRDDGSCHERRSGNVP